MAAALALFRQRGKAAASVPSEDAPPIALRIDQFGLGLSQAVICLLAGGIWFVAGSGMLLISSVTREISDEWGLDPLQRGFIVTMAFLGILIGNLTSGPWADAYGRRQPILACYGGGLVFSVLSSYSSGFVSLCVLRLFVGFSFGVGQPACHALISETSPSKWRLVMMIAAHSLFVVGASYSSLLVLMDDPLMVQLQWRTLLRLGAMPALFLGALCAAFLTESPSYLALKGRNDEAKAALEAIREANGADASVDFKPPSGATAGADMTSSQRLAYIFGPQLKGTTLILMLSCFVLNFCYWGSYYAFPQVLPDLEMDGSPAFQLLLGALWEGPGFVLAMILGLQVARKPSIKLYLFGTLASALLFTVGIGHSGEGAFVNFAVSAGYYGLKVFLGMGFILVYLYAAEVFPTEVRVTGNAICLGAGRVAGMISPLAFEIMLSWTGRYSMFFASIMVLAFVNFFLISLLPFETFGVELKDHVDAYPEDSHLVAKEKQAYGAAGKNGAPDP